MMKRHMLSTDDNPFNPHTQFDAWYAYDTQLGYHTLSYLARIAKLSDAMSEADQDLETERAIDEILEENILGIYIKVPEPSNSSENG